MLLIENNQISYSNNNNTNDNSRSPCLLLECRITTEIFQKKGCDFNACNNVRDILYNADAINSIVKWIVHSPVGKLVYTNICFFESSVTSL